MGVSNLAGEGGRSRRGTSGVTGRVGERLAGQQRRLLLLGHNFLGGWRRKAGEAFQAAFAGSADSPSENTRSTLKP